MCLDIRNRLFTSPSHHQFLSSSNRLINNFLQILYPKQWIVPEAIAAVDAGAVYALVGLRFQGGWLLLLSAILAPLLCICYFLQHLRALLPVILLGVLFLAFRLFANIKIVLLSLISDHALC